MTIEGVTLLWFLIYISMKVSERNELIFVSGKKESRGLDCLSWYQTNPRTILDDYVFDHNYCFVM